MEPAGNSSLRGARTLLLTPSTRQARLRKIVALSRHGHAELTAARGAERIPLHRAELGYVVDAISRRGEAHSSDMTAEDAEELRQGLRKRVDSLLDTWTTIASGKSRLPASR